MDSLKKFLNSADKNNQLIYFSNFYDCLYLTGFNSTNSHVFYYKGQWFYLTDERYFNAAQLQLKKFAVLRLEDRPLKKIIFPILKAKNATFIVDKNDLKLNFYEELKNSLKTNSIPINAISFPNIRAQKTSNELLKMKEALKITEIIWKKLKSQIKVGMSEQTIKKLLLKLIFDSSAENFSFMPIIAIAENSANPHWTSSEKILTNNTPLLCDFGIKYKNYCSDFSRTIYIGKKIPLDFKQMYALVEEAIRIAIKCIKPGIKAKKVDLAVRKFFKEKKVDKNFPHSLGHSLGLDIHEDPNFSPIDETVLQPGMILTIEPGLYFKDKFGIRIEQEVVVTKTACKCLNTDPIKLISV